MNKVVSFLKKTLKVFLWVLLCYVLLLIVIAILIQIPAIQTKITNYATSFISNKTHTRVNIKKVNITFPKSIVIQGIFLEDENKDTLLSAGYVKINLALKDMLNHELNIRSFALEETKLNVNRIKTDSLFNYNFLLTAFSDTSKKEVVKDKEKSEWAIRINKVRLKNIQLNYHDDYGGTNFSAELPHLKLKMDQIDLEQSIFKIDELLIESLNASVLIKSGKSSNKESNGLFILTANKIQISNSNINFGDSINKQSVIAGINQLKLKRASVNLQEQMVSLQNFNLSKSEIHYITSAIALPSDTIVELSKNATQKSNWKVSVTSSELDDNFVSYNNVSKPKIESSFDAAHLNHKHVILKATDFYYSSAKTEVVIENFEMLDPTNFSISEFKTDFHMDQHSISSKNIKLKTASSTLEADLKIQFSSIQSLKDSIQSMLVDLDIRIGKIANSDMLYFVPQLSKQAFFNNGKNSTSITGKITGPVNNLTGENLEISTGENTTISTDFTLVGLPDFKTTSFNFPNLIINTGKNDLMMIADTLIPKSIELPESIHLQIAFDGTIKSFETTVDMSSSFGSAHVFATIDETENFNNKLRITDFDLGSLLKNKSMFGPVTLIAETNGHGLDKNNIEAKLKAEVSDIYINKYTYHKLNIDGTLTGQEFAGKINLNDKNAAFDFNGLVSLKPNREYYKFHLNLKGANLQKLNFTKDDIRIGLNAESNLNGGTINELNGDAVLSNIIIANKGETFRLDSFILFTTNEPGKSEFNVTSPLMDVKFMGSVSPFELPDVLVNYMNNYFSFSDTVQVENEVSLPTPSDFNFEIQVHNHSILSEVFFPQLKKFESGFILGNFNSEQNNLNVKASIKNIIYGTTNIKDFVIDINSDVNTLNYKISSSNISNSQFEIDHLLLDGKITDNKIFANISSTDDKQNKKLLIRSQITKDESNYKLTIDPENFYLMNERWDIAADNYIEFGKPGFLIHHFFIQKKERQVNISSVNNQMNDDINIRVKNFKLDDISGIIEKDTGMVKGNVDGNMLLKRVDGLYGIIADATISKLFVQQVSIGDLTVKAENPTTEKFDLDVNLSSTENNLTAKGYFVTAGKDKTMNIDVDIQSLSMKTVQAFSMGTIKDATGNLTGNFLIEGKSTKPLITGKLLFENTFITPTVLNNPLQLKHETLELKKDGFYLNSFTILDASQNVAVINGSVLMEQFKNFIFAINVDTKDFLLLNTTAKDNKELHGRMIIDSRIDINGPLKLPVINAKLKLKKGSNFTFAVPEKRLTADKGEGVVAFNSSLKSNPILNTKKEIQQSGLTGFDISSIIELDKQATIRLLLDPSTTDSLVVKGEAALSFGIDRSGKMSLTGAYNLNEGSYLVTLESIIKRRFVIKPGGSIQWNGDPLNAEVSLDATYSVRASPIDLVADQMSGVSESEKNAYKQEYPFVVLLKLRGLILQPEISFEIQLAPEDKGILGGAVNAKLLMLNEDPSALNKQVFALLVLGRFIQENPLQTESNVASTIVRTTVGKILSEQLNQLSSKIVPGVELNFDIQSYDDYQSGQAEGRTQLDIGVKKQLFNERLTVQVGGKVDVEGEKAKQNSTDNFTSDFIVEYELTKDGRYRLKGFRHNQYEGAIEGQLIETGIGVLYVRDFNKWKEFFKKPTIKSEPSKNE